MAIFEVLNNQQSYFNRYFRRNVGDDDYATHSSVTVDRIVMDVNPSAGNGNTGLPTGAPAVTDNVLQTIDFAYSGTISELYRNGSDYFKGIIASVKYYLSGELIHSWSINSNSSTESDSVGGLLLTFINGNTDDWGLFDRQADGDWWGQELVAQPVDFTTGWIESSNATITGAGAFITSAAGGIASPAIMDVGSRYSVSISANAVPDDYVLHNFQVGSDNPLGPISSNINTYEFVALDDGFYFRITTGSSTYENTSLSVKEVLKNV